MSSEEPRRRTFPVPEPLDLARTVAALAHGTGDPTIHIDANGLRRATRTSEGPATVCLQRDGARIHAAAWGPGAGVALEMVPSLLGADDDPRALATDHALLATLQRRLPGLRMTRTGAMLEALVPAVIEQKVTGVEARRAYRRLVRAFGAPAPGPGDLLLPPEPSVLARLPYHAFHPLGLERRRAETIRAACAVAPALEQMLRLTPDQARHRLGLLPGVGPWTAAEATRTAMGDPDAVSVGDYHVPNLVCWALAGEPRGSDARMLELLEPYRGQRGRVVRLLELSGIRPPRYGPRQPPRHISHL